MDYSESCQKSKMEGFAKIVDGLKPLTISVKRSIFAVWQGSEYPTAQGVFLYAGTIADCCWFRTLNLEKISHIHSGPHLDTFHAVIVLVFFIIDFKHVNGGWVAQNISGSENENAMKRNTSGNLFYCSI